MKITVIPTNGSISIDGEVHHKIDLSSLDPTIHAIQWYDTEGEVEIKDARGRIVENRKITSFDEFAFVIPLWESVKLKSEQDEQALKDAQAQYEQSLADAKAQAQQTP